MKNQKAGVAERKNKEALLKANKAVANSMTAPPAELPYREEESMMQNESDMPRQYGEFVTDVNCPMSLLANLLVEKVMRKEPHLDDQ